jgi:sugar phosphate isomerase/epimerase
MGWGMVGDMRTSCIIRLAGLALACAGQTVFAQTTPTPGKITNPFFAMDTGTKDTNHQSIESQVALVEKLGFAGWGPTFTDAKGVEEMFASLDKHHLKMQALFTSANFDAGKESVTPRLKEAIQSLKGRDTFLWISVGSKKYKPSSTEGDAGAVEALREISRLAAESGVRVALYPHAKNWVERVEDGVRLVDEVGSNNLGVTFNLCHWMQVDGKDLQGSLSRAMPHLFVVTICGADAGGHGWAQLIQPLDKGTYDVGQVLQTLHNLGYTGPIGLQHYGIGGDAGENLKHSMEGWRKLCARATH